MEQDYGELPVEDFIHKLMVNIVEIKWTLVFIAAVLTLGIFL